MVKIKKNLFKFAHTCLPILESEHYISIFSKKFFALNLIKTILQTTKTQKNAEKGVENANIVGILKMDLLVIKKFAT